MDSSDEEQIKSIPLNTLLKIVSNLIMIDYGTIFQDKIDGQKLVIKL